MYSFEYEVMPLYVEFLENNPDAEYILIDSSIWKKDIATFSQPKYIEWDEISCEIIGDMNSEFVILYEFPKPFDIPLAKYGAVYINKQSHIYNYYTLENHIMVISYVLFLLRYTLIMAKGMICPRKISLKNYAIL